MGQISSKLRRVQGGYSHWCPGCQSLHAIHTDEPNHCGARWSFDGNLDQPTFSPSINISVRWSQLEDEPGLKDERCHYFLRGGQLQFLPDSTHEMAGKTVPLPDLPEGYRD